MKHEFKIKKFKNATVYTLESASGGATSSGAVASVSNPVGGIQRRNGDNLIAQEGDTIKVPVTQKPRQGPLRPQTGGGAHRDKKKEQKQGKEKHRKPYMEDHEVSMASNELKSIHANAKKLLALVQRYGEQGDIEAWQQSKITKAADYLNSVLQSIGGEQDALEGGGFVDVTNWSDRDVQRLGHHDDPEGDAWQRRQDAMPKIKAWVFYDVKPGQEDMASIYKIRKLKNGKWAMPEYDKSGRTYAFQRNQADKIFGPGKRWEPKNEDHSTVGGWGKGSYDTYAGTRHGRGVAEDQYLDHLSSLLEEKQRLDPSCWKGYKKQGTKMKGGVRVNNCVPAEDVEEDWQKVNKRDKTDGMSRKAVKAYRRENPGSKLKTAVTTKPSKLKKGGKAAKRRKSFCARMSGMKKAHASAKTKRNPDSPINKALRRWNCEEDVYMNSLNQQVLEKLNPQADVDVWVQDFQKADPNKYHQFKNKTPQKKAQMAVAARYAANEPSKKK